MSELLVLIGIALALLSGLPGLLLDCCSLTGQALSVLLAVLGNGLGLFAVIHYWAHDESQLLELSWTFPGADFSVAMDGLSAIFLLPVFLMSLVANVYGLSYWNQAEHPKTARKLRFFYGTLTAGMALLVIARNSIVFLFGWEIMALSAFFLVATEDQYADVRAAGWLYLVATHIAALLLFALFAVLHGING
ncbi:MAG: hydrogenase, partial [Gemmataceae bacterium]